MPYLLSFILYTHLTFTLSLPSAHVGCPQCHYPAEKFSEMPIIHRGRSKFLCIFNPTFPVQPQFPFHRVLESLAIVSSIGYEASPKHLLTLHFYLHFSCSFLCLEYLLHPTHSSRLNLEVAFFVKLFCSPPEELILSFFLFLLHSLVTKV